MLLLKHVKSNINLMTYGIFEKFDEKKFTKIIFEFSNSQFSDNQKELNAILWFDNGCLSSEIIAD